MGWEAPDAAYFTMSVLSTVGNPDAKRPTGPSGKMALCIACVVGVFVTAMVLGTVASSVIERRQLTEKKLSMQGLMPPSGIFTGSRGRVLWPFVVYCAFIGAGMGIMYWVRALLSTVAAVAIDGRRCPPPCSR